MPWSIGSSIRVPLPGPNSKSRRCRRVRLPGASVSRSDFCSVMLLTSTWSSSLDLLTPRASSGRGGRGRQYRCVEPIHRGRIGATNLLEHSFNGEPFTVGIEEELMLLDPATLDLAQGIEAVLADVPPEHADQVKPELFQSVLEVATTPCGSVADAAEQLAALRRLVGGIAER